MRKQACYLLAVMFLAANAYAASPALVYVSYIDYSPHPVIGNVRGACTRANGGVLFTDGYADDILQVATPLTSDGTNDNAANSWNVYTVAGYGSAEGTQGIAYDGASYYTCGMLNASNSCILVQITDPNNGSTYAGTPLTPSVAGKFSGPAAVGLNNIVMADYATGSLQFFTVSGSNATANGSAIANTNVNGFSTTQVVYYESGATKKIFAFMAKDTATRRIDVFNTDGTPAGTTYAGTFANSISTNFALENTNGLKFCNLAVNADRQILIAAADVNNAGTNGYDVFELSTIPTDGSAVPYQEIRDSTMNNGSSNFLTAGAAFFSTGGKDYVALTNSNRLHVYQLAPSAVMDWPLF